MGKAGNWLAMAILIVAACDSSNARRRVKQPDAGDEVSDAVAPASGGQGGTAGDVATGGEAPTSGGANTGGTVVDASAGGAVVDASAGGTIMDASVDATTPVDGSVDAGVRSLYVNPASGDDTSDGFPESPLRTTRTAFAKAAAGDTVWLEDGVFPATEAAGLNNLRVLPAGVNLRAVHPGQVTVNQRITTSGGTSLIEGITVASGVDESIAVTSGTVTLRQVVFGRSGGGSRCVGTLSVSGDAKVVLDSADDPDFDFTDDTAVVGGFARLSGTAELVIRGGIIDGVQATGCSPSGVFNVGGSSKLTLSGVSASGIGSPHFLITGQGDVSLIGGTVFESPTIVAGQENGVRAIWIGEGATATKLTLTNASIIGPYVGGIVMDTGTPTVTITDSTIAAAGFGITAPAFQTRGGNATAAPMFTMTRSTVRSGSRCGMLAARGGTFTITDSTFSGNGANAHSYSGTCGGLAFADSVTLGAYAYSVKMRGTKIIDNVDAQPSAVFAGLRLQGAPGSSYDLGTLDEPGGNTFSGNAATGLRVETDAAVVTHASGNTWVASTQGTDANGHFALGTAPCGSAAPCAVTSGTGVNFIVTSGTLNLVE